MDYVCNRCLFSIPSKVEMAEEQEYLQFINLIVNVCYEFSEVVVCSLILMPNKAANEKK